MIEKLKHLDASYTSRLRIAEKPGILRNLAVLFAHSGDSWFVLVGLGIIWWQGESAWRARASAMILSILITAFLVMVVKFSVRRQRPEGDWGGIYRKTDPHSFPSGHAARAAMLAVLGLGFGPPWFGALLTVWAPLVTLARVAMGVHFLSDVLAGVLFGILIGIGVLAFNPSLTNLV